MIQKNGVLLVCGWALLSVTMMGCDFYDHERAASEKFTGNFYIVRLNLPEHPGAYLVFLEKPGRERQLLKYNEQLDYLKADDSIMLARAIDDHDTSCYLIRHAGGDSVVSIDNIDQAEFASWDKRIAPHHIFPGKAKQ